MRIGILADAHGNWRAFDTAVEVLENEGADSFVFLGDACGYLPSTKVVTRLMNLERSRAWTSIMGNHEETIIGTEPLPPQVDVVMQLSWFRSQLDDEALLFLRGLPRELCIAHNGARVLGVHGTPDDQTRGYLYPEDPIPSGLPVSHLLMANTHWPFVRQEGSITAINPGSCGLPRDDGRYGSVALLDLDAGSAEVLRFPIDWEPVIDELKVDQSVWAVTRRRASTLVGRIVPRG